MPDHLNERESVEINGKRSRLTKKKLRKRSEIKKGKTRRDSDIKVKIEDLAEFKDIIYDDPEVFSKLALEDEFSQNFIITNKNLNKKGKDGKTSLQRAAFEGNYDEFIRLLNAGANPQKKDKFGNNVLMNAVLYLDENLNDINTDDDKSPELLAKMESKKKIVDYILENNLTDIHATNKQAKSAFALAFYQGYKYNESGKYYELRGDHEIMDSLLKAGSMPVMGFYEKSFIKKTLYTVALGYAFNGFDVVIDGAGSYLGVPKFITNIAKKLTSFVKEPVIFKRGYDDAHSSAAKYCRTALDSSYENRAFLNLEDKPFIGAFYVTWYGKVISGDKLKDYLAVHAGYYGADKAIYKGDDLKNRDLTDSKKLEIRNEISSNYKYLISRLNKRFMLPWTRRALKAHKLELEKAYSSLRLERASHAGEISNILNHFLGSNYKGKIEIEILNTPNCKEFFTELHKNVQKGMLQLSLADRYNLEKVYEKINDPEVVKIAEKRRNKKAKQKDVRFSELASFIQNSKEGKSLTGLMKIKLDNLKEHITQEAQKEKVKKSGRASNNQIIDGAASAIAYATGSTKNDVLKTVSEGLGTACGYSTGAVQVLFSRKLQNPEQARNAALALGTTAVNTVGVATAASVAVVGAYVAASQYVLHTARDSLTMQKDVTPGGFPGGYPGGEVK